MPGKGDDRDQEKVQASAFPNEDLEFSAVLPRGQKDQKHSTEPASAISRQTMFSAIELVKEVIQMKHEVDGRGRSKYKPRAS